MPIGNQYKNNCFSGKKKEKQPAELVNPIQKREQFRQQKKRVEADSIRKQLQEKGIELLDSPQGVKWKKVP